MRANAVAIVAAFSLACGGPGSSQQLSDAERLEIAREIQVRIRAATDLAQPGVADRMLSLYADTGRLVSAAGGRVLTSRDSLAMGVRYFWENIGANMRSAAWMWDEMLVDVLSRDAAVFTGRYHIPHQTPRGRPHVIGGAWTAVFRREPVAGRWVIVQEHLSDLPAEVADSIHAAMGH